MDAAWWDEKATMADTPSIPGPAFRDIRSTPSAIPRSTWEQTRTQTEHLFTEWFHRLAAPRGRRYLQEFLLLGDGRQVSDTEVPLLRAAADAEAAAGLHHVTVQQPDGFVGRGGRVVFGVGEAAILPAEVHHEPELPEGPHGAEQGDEQVLVGVPGDLADEDLAAGSGGGPVPR
ncbi:hypothetical protein EYF80_062087 [Liparis tanakae]|uniref:Uncharacterized protein n=1 Tax=Liparis tanakae TaxID=230148 RepID=A0A4Z2EFW0_9TELE|nr:hypothetical protein EYF80_062087 [Liparis tanakae]